MENEERPTKMRKLEHSEREEIAQIAEESSLSTTIGASHSVEMENGASVKPEEASETTENATVNGGEEAPPKISKNQLKKQRRLERWESGREDRKLKRKEKIKEKKERRREAWAQEHTDENGNTIKPPPSRIPRNVDGLGKQVPITVIFDCDFEDLMFDHELKSLGLQITRCYSDNRKAKFRTHLALSSFGGKMKERFDGILAQQYAAWKNFQFFEEDFVAVAEKSKEWMSGPRGGEVDGALETSKVDTSDEMKREEGEEDDDDGEGEIIYLSSESENTLTHLKPNSTYIIGGLVDKNRHKGICHKRAVGRNIKTAKLPIGEYLEMKSRQVLVTNHVLEIMLKWLELGDWGQAFMAVMPKRKGGRLKGEVEDDEEGSKHKEEDAEAAEKGPLSSAEGSDEKAVEASISTEPTAMEETKQ